MPLCSLWVQLRLFPARVCLNSFLHTFAVRLLTPSRDKERELKNERRRCTRVQEKRDERDQDKGERVRKGSWDERETTRQDIKQWRLERLRESAAGLQKLIHIYTHFTEIYTSTITRYLRFSIVYLQRLFPFSRDSVLTILQPWQESVFQELHHLGFKCLIIFLP